MRIPKGGIAFFDSGIGGLTVLAECRKLLPQGIFYYYGDNGHAPYGNLPQEKIQKYVRRAFRRFRRLKVQAAVLACNTATALCAESLRKQYSFPIVGAEPALMLAGKKGGRAFVLSTQATYESPRFQALLKRARESYPQTEILAYPCPNLAGEIERRIGEEWDYSKNFPEGKPSTVVLGCTHYIYIAEQIQAHYGCEVVDGNQGIAKRLNEILKTSPQPPSDHRRPLFKKNTPEKQIKEKNKGVNPPRKGKKKKEKSPQEIPRIFFLGGHKTQNFKQYEQMFVLKVVKKG